MPPIKPGRRPYCYICAATEDLTDDHIPPRGFFPVDKRVDLITAPLCRTCHSPLSPDDEAMRLWLSSSASASASGKWIAKHEAIPAARKKPKFLAQIRQHIKSTFVYENGEFRDAEEIQMPQARVVPFIRRITKGLLYTRYPDYDYFADSFTVAMSDLNVFQHALPLMISEERGGDVFEFWHGFAVDRPDAAIWIFRFYCSTVFVCMHRHGDDWKQVHLPGYKEFEKLPKFL